MQYPRYISIIIQILLCLSLFINCEEENDFVKLQRILREECENDKSNFHPELRKDNKTCKVGLDGYMKCWMETAAGSTATDKCVDTLFLGIGETTRFCDENGNWAKRPNTDGCKQRSFEDGQKRREEIFLKYELKKEEELERERELRNHQIFLEKVVLVLRYIDGSICLVGLSILTYLIPLKNTRFLLHRNLIFTFFLYDLSQIIVIEFLRKKHNEACTYVFFVTQYIFLCQISWMFNEAFFYFRQFFFVFVKKKYIWSYFLFGYGFPAVITYGIYLPLILTYPPIDSFSQVCWESYNTFGVNAIIYYTAYVLISFNFLIIAYILVVLWQKLQLNSDMEKAKKTTRGFIFLSIILGGGYLGTLLGPENEVWLYFRICVNPTQGMMICLVHVFLSREVRKAAFSRLRKYIETHDSSLEPSTHMSSVNGDMKSRVSSFMKNSMRKSKADEYNIMTPSKSTDNIQMIASNKLNNVSKIDIPKINVTPTEQQTNEESFTKEIEIKKEDEIENNDTRNNDEKLPSNNDSNITESNINKGYDDVIDDDNDLKQSNIEQDDNSTNSNNEQGHNTTNSNIEQGDNTTNSNIEQVD